MEITIVKNKDGEVTGWKTQYKGNWYGLPISGVSEDEARKIGTKYMEEKIPLIDKYQKEYEEKSAHHRN